MVRLLGIVQPLGFGHASFGAWHPAAGSSQGPWLHLSLRCHVHDSWVMPENGVQLRSRIALKAVRQAPHLTQTQPPPLRLDPSSHPCKSLAAAELNCDECRGGGGGRLCKGRA